MSLSKKPLVYVITRECSDRSNLTVFRTLKNAEIVAFLLVARNDKPIG